MPISRFMMPWLLLALPLASPLGAETGGTDSAKEATESTETRETLALATPASPTSPELTSPHEVLVANGFDPTSINLDARASNPDLVSDEVVLADGDVIRGKITSENDDEVVLLHPVFKEMRIPRERIVAIRRDAPSRRTSGFGEAVAGAGVRPPSSPTQPPATTTTQETAKPTTEPGKEPADTVETRSAEALIEKSNWSFILGTAFGYVQNVNNEVNVRLSAQAEHNSEYARLRIDSAYFLNSTNDEIIDNDIIVTTTQDWFFPDSRWSIFANATYQWDAFELWEHRVSGYLGPGFKLVNETDLVIDLRVGAGATYEYGVPQLLPEALLSFEWTWNIDDRQSVNGIFSYAPDITEISQYRLSLNAEWNFQLQKEKGLSFYVGVRNLFQSIVPVESTQNDLRVFGGIKYEF